MNEISKFLILAGLFLIVAGAAVALFNKVPGFGKLPGDILIRRENYTFYFPLASCILLSVILNLIFWFFNRR